MYIFDKSRCTQPFESMIHGLAIFAALTNLSPFSFVPDEPISPSLVAYAKACHLRPEDMLRHMQNDSFARQQFASWKASDRNPLS